MPIDRNPQNTLKPKLASNRTAKTPLTPRLAAAPPPSSVQSVRPVRSSNGTTPRANTTVHEDVTPVKAFLSSNITPRSSSRKSRVGVGSPTSTPNDTPTSTPSSSRPASTTDFGPRELGGPLGAGSNGAVRPRLGAVHNNNLPGPQSLLSSVFSPPQHASGPAKDASMFFHANEARPQEQLLQQKKAPLFFYANGRQDESSQKLEGLSPPLSSLGKTQSESKFFHANSVSEGRSRSPALTPPPISISPEPLNPPAALGPSLRAPSPTKEWAHLSYRKGASQVIRPALVTRNSGMSALPGQTTPEVPEITRRRSSAASVIRRGHTKSASVSSIDSVTSPRRNTSTDLSGIIPSPLHHESRVMDRIVSNASLPESIASAPSPQMVTFSGLPSPVLTSPIKPASTQSALETMNELAANARRERKVLDLEISNSSLLAINRSLEKEVRKQKAELRRFRRLSRAGRFSMDTIGSAVDTLSPSAATHIADLSDMSEEEEVEEEEDPDSSDASLDEGQLSPAAQEAKDEAHRVRDEKRLHLDLSKHRDMLIDSQKMNQSLKRCMNWTEQLIKDGQKALEYQVRVSDVKLGGRVLVSEDDGHDTTQTEESKGLLSPWSPLHSAMDALDSPFFPGVHKLVDRDSGVDIDGFEGVSSHLDDETALLGSPFEERIKRLHASIEALEQS